MKRIMTAVLFLIAATLASAQEYTYNFTAPIGAIHCSNRLGQLPAVNHGCPMSEFVGTSGTQTGNFQTQGLQDGTDYFIFRINPANQAIDGNGTWAPLSAIPPAGVPVTFTFNATISDVCTAECVAASGNFQLQGDFAWQLIKVCFRSCVYYQQWANTSPVVVEGQSTVAILDELKRQREIQARIQADLDNDPCEPIILFPWDGPDEPIIIYPQVV